MKNYRRQRQQYFFASLLGAFAVINVLFFVILYYPARAEYIRLRDSIEKNRTEVAIRTQKIAALDKLSKQLETSAQDKSQLIAAHFLPRSPGWSELLPLLEAAVQKAGVKNPRQTYGIDEAPQYGLYSVKIVLPVAGSYSGIINFLKELEESQTFIIINSISVQGGAGNIPGELGMAMNLETFFYQ